MAEAADMAVQMLPEAFALVLVVVGLSMAFSVGKISAKRQRRTNREKRIETLLRDSEYVEVVHESDDGHGLAVRDSDGGVDLVSFGPGDEVYSSVWISPRGLTDTANVLSEHAVEKGEINA